MIIDPTDFILCGMPSELQILTAAFPNNPVFGGTAKSNLATLVPSSCKRVISMGLGGGLSPAIKIAGGAVASKITDGSKIWSCDATWNHEVLDLAANLYSQTMDPWARGFVECTWYSSGVMNQADTAAQRSTLLVETGAWGIDDESNAAAIFCQQHDLKLNVLRFCSDDSSETLPLAARGKIMNADGSANLQYLLQELVSEGLMQDAMLAVVLADFDSSLAALQQAAQALSPV
jgi:adenosylhomocysteine nucleosidase